MKRTASARWSGDGLSGKGDLTTQSEVLKGQAYSFQTRFKSEDGKAGTNPEELVAAAHAGCFTMALAFALSGAGHTPELLETSATVDLRSIDGHFEIAGIALDLKARVPGLDAARFEELARDAKANCPVSRALAATPITLSTSLA